MLWVEDIGQETIYVIVAVDRTPTPHPISNYLTGRFEDLESIL
jgi:hypothetical protein